jgi:TPR repeat protein
MVKALSLYEAECEGGHAEACSKIASLYANEPVFQNEKGKAQGYLEKSCRLGEASACAEIHRQR